MTDEQIDLRTVCARVIWSVVREYEDGCDLALEDLPRNHYVWFCEDEAIEAVKEFKKGGAQ